MAGITDFAAKETTERWKGGRKGSGAQWERWCLGMCVLVSLVKQTLPHRSSPQERARKLWVFGLCLWETRSWFWGFAVRSSQPTTSCMSVSEHIEGPLQRSVGHRFKSSFQDKNREKNHHHHQTLFRFQYRDVYTTKMQISCVWPRALNSLNKSHESLKPWNFNYALSAGHQTFPFTSIRVPRIKETCT